MPYKQYPKFDHKNIHLTYQNSFRFGYNGEWFNYRQSPNDIWHVRYQHSSRPVGSFREESINTLRLMHETVNDKLVLLFSGGLDSEFVAHALMASGVPFRVAILRFADNLNLHDIKYAFDFCAAYGIKPQVFTLAPYEFFNGPAYVYADETYCISPIMLSTMWLLDQIDGYPILGSGDLILEKNTYIDMNNETIPFFERHCLLFDGIDSREKFDEQWYHKESERSSTWLRYFMIRNRPGCPGFFNYNPELVYSYLLDPVIQDMVQNKMSISNMTAKYKLYASHFRMADRPKNTGVEAIQVLIANNRKKLLMLYPGSNGVYKHTFNEFLEQVSYNGRS